MAKQGYDSMLLPGEELMYKIQGVYDVSQQHVNSIGTLYITTFQTFFVDEGKEQLKTIIPHGCIASIKKYKHQSTNNVPIADKAQYLEVRCKDLRVIKYVLPATSHPNEVRRYLEYACIPDDLHETFAFAYSPQVPAFDEGWNVYDPIDEFKRIGLITDEEGPWRASKLNSHFTLCPTYPDVFIVPSSIDDVLLTKVADYRSKGRIPVCVWKHSTTSATISRCSQPLVGLGKRSEEDEAMLREIQRANRTGSEKTLFIVDARPKVNAAACSLAGGGTEVVSHYHEARAMLEYCGIANIHVVREAFKRLGKVCNGWDPRKSKWNDVVATHWLDHISTILTAAVRMVNYVDQDGCSVLVHCTDGWDRTSQLCALAEMLMDPYYRTIKGFVVLICKEFISFGHKFSTRNGVTSQSPTSQCAPIFVQFMDCVWQLTRQFPTSFEYSENLLVLITSHLYSHVFGTFLCDNECERATFAVRTQTASLWGLVLNPPPALAVQLVNPMYTPHPGTLRGTGSLTNMQLWRGYYQRWTALGDEKKENGNENGKTNGIHGTDTAPDTTILHESVLLPFLDNMNYSEKTQARKDFSVWLSIGGGRVREKIRVVTVPRKTPTTSPETKEKYASMRSSSSRKKKKDKHAPTHADEEDEPHDGRSIRRGRSFSALITKVTGKDKDKEKKDTGRNRAYSSEEGKGELPIDDDKPKKDKLETISSHSVSDTKTNTTPTTVATEPAVATVGVSTDPIAATAEPAITTESITLTNTDATSPPTSTEQPTEATTNSTESTIITTTEQPTNPEQSTNT